MLTDKYTYISTFKPSHALRNLAKSTTQKDQWYIYNDDHYLWVKMCEIEQNNETLHLDLKKSTLFTAKDYQ